jgi:dTDP-4-dehydrorhamnose reductase
MTRPPTLVTRPPTPTRWLVTGAGGMLGRDLVSLLEARGAAVVPVTRGELDITDRKSVLAVVRDARPDVVVNCAAWTAVDLAESREAAALAVNGDGAGHVAAACAQAGARMVQLSTDYVFDGTARVPYPETAVPAPATAYGRTKLAGEQAVLAQLPGSCYIVRTAWLYGAHGGNFVATMMRLEREQPTVSVVNDQYGQPTSTLALAQRIAAMIAADAAPGTYHATCSGQTTWWGLAREVFRQVGADPDRVKATSSTSLTRPAPRPGYSVLGHDAWTRAGLDPMAEWHEALSNAIPMLTQ